MACHGELARLKPHPDHLTTFYLMIAFGGALGGVFVALVAPRLFSGYDELPAASIVTALLLTTLATILGNLTLAFANSAEVGTSFFDARRVVFWSIFASMTVVVAILLTVPQAGALFQVTAPPLPVLALTILAAVAAGSWYGFGKILKGSGMFGRSMA